MARVYTKPMKTITICSSALFYKHVMEIKEQLEARGFVVLVPKTALSMAKTGDFEVLQYKTWFGDANDYHKKADYMLSHFDEVTKGDAVLVVNDAKHGVAGYIGPNVLMEMALAFYQRKPIYILNGLPDDSPFEEELKGMMPVILKGDLAQIL